MKATIDAAGRLVIRAEIRRQAAIQSGMPPEARWTDSRIEIAPSDAAVQLVRHGRLLVGVPEDGVEHLGPEAVDETRQAVAEERASVTSSPVEP
ncbi:MAG TPA: antitoxin [Chloroflexota bacterium]|nr:antitoxin [Chloroflexota bacterium]